MTGGGKIRGRRKLPDNMRSDSSSVTCHANETISKWNIVVVVGKNGDFPKVEKASALVAADCEGVLMVATHAAASGRKVRCRPLGTIEAQNTNGLTVGDPVYLSSTGGGWSTTKTGFVRMVGSVQVVSATIGIIQFNGVSNASTRFKTGTGTIVSGQTALTIAAATLGGVYGGKNVWVQGREEPTNAVYIRSAAWSTNDLVVTASGDPGASNFDFNYMIEVG